MVFVVAELFAAIPATPRRCVLVEMLHEAAVRAKAPAANRTAEWSIRASRESGAAFDAPEA